MKTHKDFIQDRLDTIDLDCGDNSCLFTFKKGGMRTNGGCRCVDKRSQMSWSDVEKQALKYKQIIVEILKELENV